MQNRTQFPSLRIDSGHHPLWPVSCDPGLLFRPSQRWLTGSKEKPNEGLVFGGKADRRPDGEKNYSGFEWSPDVEPGPTNSLTRSLYCNNNVTCPFRFEGAANLPAV